MPFISPIHQFVNEVSYYLFTTWQDLNDPVTGLYSFRPALDKRVAFLAHMLRSLETKPTGYVPDSVLTLQYLGLISSPGNTEFSNSSKMLQSPVRKHVIATYKRL